MKTSQRRLHALLALTLALAPAKLAAQAIPSPFASDQAEFYRSDVAGNRVLPEYDSAGIASGSFRLRGALRVTGAYDSNVLNLAGNARDDAVAVIEPSLALRSEGSRHSFSISGNARLLRFPTIASEDTDSWRVGARGGLDLGNTTLIDADFAAERQYEQRGAGGLLFPTGSPVLYRQVRGGLGISHSFGPLNVSLSGGGLSRRYEDIRFPLLGDVDQSFRDINIFTIAPQVGYAVSPAFNIFTRADINFTRSQNVSAGAVSRDADGVLILAGVRGEISPLLIGEIAAGYQRRSYADPTIRGFSGPTFAVKLDWYPTPLISFRLTSRQYFENSGINSVPGILSLDSSLKGYYEALRNLLLSVEVGYTYDRYRELGINTGYVVGALRTEYRFNRYLSGAVIARYRNRGSSDPIRVGRYDGEYIGIALEGRV